MAQSLLSHLSPLYTDLYQLTMAQGYFLTGRHRQNAVFDLYYRSNPFKGGYLIAAGIDEAVHYLENFRFRCEDLEYLESLGFHSGFLKYLKNFRFCLDLNAVLEGEVVFAHEPLLRTSGALMECQLAETALINLVHFPSLVATKASRMVQAAEGRNVVEFGLRRAQGLAGLMASRAAYIGGAAGTSNVLAGKMYGVPVFGTQAHSWIQAIRDEKKAFTEFARIYKDRTILLIDTYSTLKSGLPHLIDTLKRLKDEDIRIRGIRIDSGDLAYLSKKVREHLNESGFPGVQIFASGQLDEYIIESLLKQGAPIDGFGVGTKLATSYEEPALDMVYKLSEIDDKPELKISDSLEKMNEPGKKKVWRFLSKDGKFLLDAMLLDRERTVGEVLHPVFQLASTSVSGLKHEALMTPVLRQGKITRCPRPVEEIRRYAQLRLGLLPEEHKRFYFPHTYRVGVSGRLFRLKERLIARRLGKKVP